MAKRCTFQNCTRIFRARGLCSAHWQQLTSGKILKPIEAKSRRNPEAGWRANPLYFAYHAMKTRCYNSNHESYKRYGGRGIAVCDRWLESFGNFYADVGDRPEGMTLDRIDNDGDYSPENCRWATWTQQNNNKTQRRSPSHAQ